MSDDFFFSLYTRAYNCIPWDDSQDNKTLTTGSARKEGI